MGSPVEYRLEQDVAVLVLRHAPINAFDLELRTSLALALDWAEAEAGAAAVLIEAAGRSFCGGAALNELESAEAAPTLATLCQRVEDFPRPVIVALHGAVLAGGFELALAAHYRIAQAASRFACPEVTLGLLPCGGAMRRLPRLAGALAALEILQSGSAIAAGRALQLGVIDRIAADPLGADARGYARELIAAGKGPRRTGAMAGKLVAADTLAAVAAARSRTAGPMLAPARIADCVEAGLLLPPDAALAFEAAACEECRAGAQSLALRHLARAEFRALRLPAGPAPVSPRVLGLVGASRTAVAIAANALARGMQVVLVESDGAAALDARDRIIDYVNRSGASQSALKRLTVDADLEPLARTDMVLEAHADTARGKAAGLADLAGLLAPRMPLMSVTDLPDPTVAVDRKDLASRLVALRFCGPDAGTRVVEIATAPQCSPDARNAGAALVRSLGKLAIATGMGGPVGDRVLAAYRKAAQVMLEEGAGPVEIDAAMRAWGFLRGPFETLDADGLDSPRSQRLQRLADETGEPRGHEITAALIALDRIGGSGRRGYFNGPGARDLEDDDVRLVLTEVRAAKGLSPCRFGVTEIQSRCLAAMANAGARLIGAGVVQRPADIDLVMVHANGFPRWRGGPMLAADVAGPLQVRRDLRGFAEEAPGIWTPDPLFDDLIKNGRLFAHLNG